MPRAKPSPENEPVRTTVSLPYYVGQAAERFETKHRELALKGFSDLVSRALAEYIEKHHPGLIEQVAAELREMAAKSPAPAVLPVDEDKGVYVETGQELAVRHDRAKAARKNRTKSGGESAKGKAGHAKKS